MITNRSRKLSRKKKKSLSKKNTVAITIPIFLIAALIFTNVTVSAKTYQLINCNRELDSLKSELKDLNEEKEAITSPVLIREKAINDLKMIDIENIDELISIQP